MACYRVTVLGSKRTGKTALSHFLVTGSSLPQYEHTEEINMRYVQFVHEDQGKTLGYPLGNCFLMIEDTPGWSSGDRKDDYPELLTSVPMTYLFKETGCTKAGLPPPPDVDQIAWWEFWNDGKVEPPEVEPAPGCSPLEGKGTAQEASEKRQAFIVVYSVKDEASFREAEELVAELMGLMEPVEEEAEPSGDEKKKMVDPDLELPPQPIVLVSTHNDLKKGGPGSRVDAEAGRDLANGFGLPFVECNAKGLGVHEAFELAISAIQKCEDNMTFDVAPGILSRCKAQCCTGCPELCCYPGVLVEKACPNQEQPEFPCGKKFWDKHCCWKNAP